MGARREFAEDDPHNPDILLVDGERDPEGVPFDKGLGIIVPLRLITPLLPSQGQVPGTGEKAGPVKAVAILGEGQHEGAAGFRAGGITHPEGLSIRERSGALLGAGVRDIAQAGRAPGCTPIVRDGVELPEGGLLVPEEHDQTPVAGKVLAGLQGRSLPFREACFLPSTHTGGVIRVDRAEGRPRTEVHGTDGPAVRKAQRVLLHPPGEAKWSSVGGTSVEGTSHDSPSALVAYRMRVSGVSSSFADSCHMQ